jgi:phage gp36-like protein
MPKYTTVSNMLVMLPGVMSRSNVSSAQMAHFIDMAEGRVDAYLVKRYPLPLSTPVPSLVETLSTQISVYELLSKRIFVGELTADSMWVRSYQQAIDDLKDIARGRMELVNSAGAVLDASNNEVWSSTEGYLPTFTEDDELNQFVDEDKIDDIRQDRSTGHIWLT